MSKKGVNIEDLDDYINTFKLKAFDSDEENDDIFSTKKKNVESEKPKTYEKKVEPKMINNTLPSQQNKINIFENENSKISQNISVNSNKIQNAPLVKIAPPKLQNPIRQEIKIEDTITNKPIVQNEYEEIYQQQTINYPVKGIQKTEISNISNIHQQIKLSKENSFKNISNDYKNILNKKVEIFTDDVLENELNKIANEDEQFQIVEVEVEKMEKIEKYEKNEKTPVSSNHNVHNVNNFSKNNNIHTEIILNEDNHNKSNITENKNIPLPIYDQNTKYAKSLHINMGISKILILNKYSLNESSKTNMIETLPISNLTFSKNDIDSILFKDYAPISYGSSLDLKYKSLSNKILTKIESKELKATREEYILFSLISSYFENNFSCNLLENSNISKRKEFLNSLKKLQYTKNLPFDKNTDKMFKLDEQVKPVDYSIGNILNKGIEKILVDCYNEKSSTNLFFFSLFGKKEDIYMYMSTIFEEHPEYKQDDIYYLFMIKSGNISRLVQEKKDFLFKNFYNFFILLLQNYEYFDFYNVNLLFKVLGETDSINKTVDMALLLNILNNSFRFADKSHNSTNNYTQMVSRYMNFPSYTKIFFSDFLNYFIYRQLKDEETLKFSAVGFCSILIKYKFYSLEVQNGKLNAQTKDYGKKIFENIKQFAGLSKNKYFIDVMKNILLESEINQNFEKNSNSSNSSNISNLNKSKPVQVIQNSNLISGTTGNKNDSIFDKEEKVAQKSSNLFEKNETLKVEENKGGISYLISALGFGSNQPKSTKAELKPENKNIREEQSKAKEEPQLQEQVPEMYYDAQKKRWVLRGKIYDDDNTKNPSLSTMDNINDINNISSSQECDNFPSKVIPPPVKKAVNILPPKIQSNINITPNKPSSSSVQEQQSKPNVNVFNPNNEEKHSTPQIKQTPSSISNPFAVNKPSTNLPKQNLAKPPQKPNLTSRYTSIIDYGN